MSVTGFRMKVRYIATQAELLMFAVILLTLRSMAQDIYSPLAVAQQGHTQTQCNPAIDLLRASPESAEPVKEVHVAEDEGYVQFGCAVGPDCAATGLHFVKSPIPSARVTHSSAPADRELRVGTKQEVTSDGCRFSGFLVRGIRSTWDHPN
jgi:hypothetical protein